MPARKPSGLIRRHETAGEQAQRAAREEELRPARGLPTSAPARLAGHDVASSAWRRMIRLYSELEAEIVTRLDQDMLIDYCMLIEQLSEMDTMRRTAYQAWLQLAQQHDELTKAGEEDAAVLMAIKVVGAFDAIVKLDGRSDRKRSLLLQWRQSLYLTPRARAGAAPVKKETEPEKDELEQLLDEFTGLINGGK